MKKTIRNIATGLVGIVGGFVGSASAETGRVDTLNKIDLPYANQIHVMGHFPGAAEGNDVNDSPYTALFNPSGISSKIISKVLGHLYGELDVDVRTNDSTSSVQYELSLISQTGNPINFTTSNELRLTIDPTNNGWDFGEDPMTFERDNGQRYGVGVLTNGGTTVGVIPYPDVGPIAYCFFHNS